MKSAAANPAQDAETLHAQLVALRSLSDHLVVVFDEFQRLRHCPGDPLAIIRSALMSSGANHVSLLFTGSIRNALKMMLEDSDQPIFGEAAQMQLPAIGRVDFLEYLDFQFEETGRPADEDALNYLLNATGAHPRSTQQLAWECWAGTSAGQHVTLETVIDAHDRLVQTIERSEFASVLNVLMSGDEARGQRGSRAAAAGRSRWRSASRADRSRRATGSPATRACAQRSCGCRGAGWSISGTAAGTSSIRCSASGCGGHRRSRTRLRRGRTSNGKLYQ